MQLQILKLILESGDHFIFRAWHFKFSDISDFDPTAALEALQVAHLKRTHDAWTCKTSIGRLKQRILPIISTDCDF